MLSESKLNASSLHYVDMSSLVQQLKDLVQSPSLQTLTKQITTGSQQGIIASISSFQSLLVNLKNNMSTSYKQPVFQMNHFDTQRIIPKVFLNDDEKLSEKQVLQLINKLNTQLSEIMSMSMKVDANVSQQLQFQKAYLTQKTKERNEEEKREETQSLNKLK